MTNELTFFLTKNGLSSLKFRKNGDINPNNAFSTSISIATKHYVKHIA